MKVQIDLNIKRAASLAITAVVMVTLNAQKSPRATERLAPQFVVDPLWPKPLPHHWVLGAVVGISVDQQDHIWIIHRPNSLEPKEVFADQKPAAGKCCSAAPPVLEFNESGDLLRSWGGPGQGYDWPSSNHGITVDFKNNVWIGGNGNGRGGSAPLIANARDAQGHPTADGYQDSVILKFTVDGKFLMQIGKPGQSKGSNDTENLRGPAKMWVDPRTDELYVADGYANKRVIVFDANTGRYKRHWGAFGHQPDDADLGPYDPKSALDQQFRNPVHCAVLSNDNLLYVCDRINDRVQVFRPEGTFVREKIYYPDTLGDGSVFDVAFSADSAQKFMYISDLTNEEIHIVDRSTLEVLKSFGDGGRQPGQFYGLHSIATDSKGNIFTTETYRGQRVQKFLYKGIATIKSVDEGAVWPSVQAKPTSDRR
jgi:DNA-binding beta-propeller fold protein YncE